MTQPLTEELEDALLQLLTALDSHLDVNCLSAILTLDLVPSQTDQTVLQSTVLGPTGDLGHHVLNLVETELKQ